VNILGNGEGGRNQEFVLGAVETIPPDTVIVAVASDGWDNSDTAGAIGDAGDRERAKANGISAEQFLNANDSYRFWKIIGGAIMTGRTGINVADFYMVLKGGD
jgi:glycerate-2-kinase